jgi:class 3 adenylate cyclase/tetratricopeptide (TPR) repeat protein
MRLGAQELAAGRAEQALKAGRRAVALNNMREDAHRLIVHALTATGRKAEALKHYQDLVALLKRELNTEPDAATRALVAELRAIQPPSGSPPSGSPPRASPAVKEIAKPAQPQPDLPPNRQRELPPNAPPTFAGNGQARAPKVSAEVPAARSDTASPAAEVGAGGPERRQLTIMVCNMVASMPLLADLDPEDMHERIAAFHKVAAEVVARFDGFVAQYLSDGVLVYFGYPTAHEHDAEQAVRAGLAMLDAVGPLEAAPGVPLQARAGIATGQVIIGEQRGTGSAAQRVAIGETPNLAAQLQAAASPGEIVIAASTRRLVGRMFDCRALSTDETAWQVRGETAGVSRFEARRAGALSRLVGRQEEIDLLLRRWDQAKLGEGRVVLFSGEPGIGKSSIAESLLTRLAGEPHARLRYFCSPHHTHSPLYPFITQLERAAGFEPDSSASAKLEKLEALFKPAAKHLSRDVALIAELLAVPLDGRYPALALAPQQRREMTLTALLDQLDGVAAKNPALIVFEDVHWIDPTSLELLDRALARVADLPVLMVNTFRPEFQSNWVGQPHVTMMPLSRLGRRDSVGIIGDIAKGKALPGGVVEQILAHTDGVPLFIEELTSSLLESGVLRETTDGYALDRPLPARAIPATLQASLVARLDRLGTVKDLAQIGAAIGREFSHELIGAVASLTPADLDAALERLTASGLISRRGTPPAATYTFKHALVQDAAYESQLKARRQAMHRSIAEVLRERFPEVAASTPEVVARHYTEASLALDAAVWWRKASDQALLRAAYVEALRHLDRGRELIAACPQTPERLHEELKLEVSRGAVLLMLRGQGAPEVREAYERAAMISRDMGESEEVFLVLFGLWRTQIGQSEMEGARETGVRLLEMAERLGDRPLLLGAKMALGVALYHIADFAGAWPLVESGVTLSDELDEHDRSSPVFAIGQNPGLTCVLCTAFILLLQGDPEAALERQRRAIAMAKETAKPFQLVVTMGWSASIHLLNGEPDAALRYTDESAALLTEYAFPAWEVSGDLTRGAAMVKLGRADEGFVLLRRGLAASAETRLRMLRLRALALFAQACAETGNIAEGLAVVREGLSELAQSAERWWEPELHRLEGELMMLEPGSGARAEAEASLRSAIAIARRKGLKLFENRAAASLARARAVRHA